MPAARSAPQAAAPGLAAAYLIAAGAVTATTPSAMGATTPGAVTAAEPGATAATAPGAAAGSEAAARSSRHAGAWTVYAGRMSSERTWHHILRGPTHVSFTDVGLAAFAYAHPLPWSYGGFDLELEWQLAKYFGDQDHWEFNVPFVARWTRFPWQRRVATSAAVALGLSYATEVPPVEVQLEGASKRLMVYWFIELSAAPPDRDWAVVSRLHHRSVAFGLMGQEGGMNALTLGLRRQFR